MDIDTEDEQVKDNDGGTKRKHLEEDGADEPVSKKRRIDHTQEQDANETMDNAEDKIIYMLVQGKKVATFQRTLCKIPGSKLYDTFHGEPALPKNEDGCYIIDRPKKAFAGILNFLRSGKFYVPKDAESKAELEYEIEYWGLSDSYTKDGGGWALYEGTTLLDKSLQKQLNEWYGKADKHWKIIYKASTDGWEATDFHKKCDNKGPTLTVISANKFLFGGFTPLHWESKGGYSWHEGSWIFSLTNPSNEPTKMVNIAAKKDKLYSIYDAPDHGPTFGGGFDIVIYSNSNTSGQNYCNLGYSFLLPGKTYGSEEAKHFMVGTYHFSVEEIEVFAYATSPSSSSSSASSNSNSSSTTNNKN